MFNNTALDVAIGFIFIFLIYSLLSTTIKESIASVFAHRSRMLERAIEQMTDGKNVRYFWWDKVINFFFWLSHTIHVWLFNKKMKNEDPKKRLPRLKPKEFVLDKTVPHPQYDKGIMNSKIMRRVKLNRKARLFAAFITEHPLYRRAAPGGLHKKPAYLPADVFSDILLDVLNPRPGQPVLLNEIAKEIDRNEKDRNHPLNKHLHQILRIYLNQANGDSQRFKLLVEDWYNKTMERVTGWYKQQSQLILFLIGLVLAISFNIDTIAIYNILTKDKTAREGMVQMAVHSRLDSSTAASSLREQSDQASNVLGLGRPYADTCRKCEALMKDTTVNAADPVTKARLERCTRFMKEQEDRRLFQYSPRQTGGLLTIIGFILTALGISLGAPFWFDLLNKIVRLRYAGDKPSNNASEASAPSKTDSLNKRPDPAAIG
jgi:hypothetical protein